MSDELIGLIGLVVFLVFVYIGMPISCAFLFVGGAGIALFRSFGSSMSILGASPFNTMSSYVWSVFPLFTFMGFLALVANVAPGFYEGARSWVGHYRGGLGYSCIAANCAFGACVGDPLTAAVTFTPMSLPSMRKQGYANSVALGAIVAASILATMIPPSGTLIIYGAITSTSISELFIAAVVPGLLLAALYALTLWTITRISPKLAPAGEKHTWKQRLQGLGKMWAFVFTIAVILGGIYAGVFTPTEAGAVGCFAMLIIALVRRSLTWRAFKEAFFEAGKVMGAVGFMIVGATIFNVFLAFTGLPQALAESISGLTQSALVFALLMMAVYFVLGMFMDPGSMTLLTVPLFFPMIGAVGMSSLQYGVLLTIMMGIGGLSPPYGMISMAIAGLFKGVRLGDVFKGSMPYIIPLVLMAILVVVLPQLVEWLPGTMAQGSP
ncbi:MAG: TRAP transporter large permease [Thermoleophilia bacterium]|nr:TRAP transporter large permease [Thermoleophilia bacterium]